MGERVERLIVVATNNAHKVDEIRAALGRHGWRFVAAGELDPEWPSPPETGSTFEENARIKARAAHERFKTAALADDSGLEVDALGGAPGVWSSRYAGPDATDEANNAKLLAALEGVPDDQRSARFRCCIVYVAEDGSELVANGVCEGRIAHAPRGTHGFGYDPLFLPAEAPGRSMAELDMDEKNRISHRGRALRELRRLLDGV